MRQFACNMGKGQNFVFHSCFYSCRTANSHIRYSSHRVRNPFHVTNGPQNASCSPLRMIFQPFPLFYTKSSWLCTLFITSLFLNDVIRRYFIGAFLYDDRNHWSSFRFICRLDFMEESRENLLWHSSYCELFRDKKCFTLFMCNLSYEFLRKKIKRICLHLLVLERVIAMNVS